MISFKDRITPTINGKNIKIFESRIINLKQKDIYLILFNLYPQYVYLYYLYYFIESKISLLFIYQI